MSKASNFCVVPWINIHIEADGRVRPCCMSIANDVSVNIKNNSIDKLMNSELLKNIRKASLNNEQHETCQNCFNLECAGEQTLRLSANEKYKYLISEFRRETSEDGLVLNPTLRSLDIRFSNLCNFKCRTCWSSASTAWYGDARVLTRGEVEFKGVQKPAGTSDQMMLFLDSIIPSLLEVNVLGGEPFIEKDQYVFLEKLIEMEKFDVSLRVNTNLSQLSLGDKQILTYLKKFQQVFVCVSCDGAGAQGELIRHGMKWDQFKENFRILQKSGIAHGIVVTVSVLNAFHIIDFIRILLKENMLFDGKQLILNILAEFCTDNIKILNHNEIMALEEKYSDFILNDLITFNLVNSDLLVGQLKNVIKFARSKPDSWDIAYERRKFVIHTLQLDGMRGERFLKLFPEYNQLFLEVIPTLGKN